ncbi:hypothetical protein E2C06_31285 [Dankookia rubra]|uniref:DED domain-containing protein n=1 Tax=Dankookia rubra TaxID=1442381 RepID=A0A4R5Q8Q4_9PROT|nr:tetratricopeptide repeat protein [Dankookia rubra]TDH58681.1 hypothetical protein E2C06_31285 [Dankookia rubra]
MICAELAIAATGLGLLTPPSSLPLTLPSEATLFLAHLAVSSVLICIAAALYRRGGRTPTFLLLVVSTATMGPLGCVGAALGGVMHWVFIRHATPFAQWYAALFPDIDTSPIRALYERLALRGGAPGPRSNVAPFLDVMALGTVQQKQAVITVIADEFRPAFVPALRSALNDVEPAIRVLAATASARIENWFLERAMELNAHRAAAPDDPDILLTLARHHDEYANTGLLDAGRAQSEWRQALECYELLNQLRPGDPDIIQAIGQLLLRLDEPARAMECLEPLAESANASLDVLSSYLDCLYRLRRVDLLRRVARRHGERISASGLPYNIRCAALLWAEGSAPDMLDGGSPA